MGYKDYHAVSFVPKTKSAGKVTAPLDFMFFKKFLNLNKVKVILYVFVITLFITILKDNF